MAIRHGSLTVLNPVNHAKDRGLTRQARVIWSYVPKLKAPNYKSTKPTQHQSGAQTSPHVGSFFRRPKDQQKKEDTRGTVYKIECNDCAAVYIGQTSRALKTRTKEHSKAAGSFDKNPQLDQHSPKNWLQL